MASTKRHRLASPGGTSALGRSRLCRYADGTSRGRLGAARSGVRRADPPPGQIDATSALLESAPVGMALIEPDGRVVRTNALLERVLGRSVQAGTRVLDLITASPEERRHLQEALIEPLARHEGGVVDAFGAQLGGEARTLFLSTNRPLGSDWAAFACRDVTRMAQLEVERLQAQKLQSIGQLAAGVAHEINTPTQYVNDNVHFARGAFDRLLGAFDAYRAFVEAVQDQADEDDRRQLARALRKAKLDYLREELPKALDQSLEGLARIAHIVAAMKRFSHPGGDEKVPVDVNELIDTTATVSRNEWKYVAELKLELDPDLPKVPCLRDELGQALLNIIVNAAHAIEGTHEEGTLGVIRVRTLQRQDGRVEIHIQDDGGGIPQALRERVFDPFFTTKPPGKGTGQGLAIARSVLVDKHGGALRLEVEEGVGTTFVLELPCNPAESEEAA